MQNVKKVKSRELLPAQDSSYRISQMEKSKSLANKNWTH